MLGRAPNEKIMLVGPTDPLFAWRVFRTPLTSPNVVGPPGFQLLLILLKVKKVGDPWSTRQYVYWNCYEDIQHCELVNYLHKIFTRIDIVSSTLKHDCLFFLIYPYKQQHERTRPGCGDFVVRCMSSVSAILL